MINLMIVDDDVQIREGISTGIKWSDIGISGVAAFGDGVDALNAFEEFDPDIIITDVKMAQMNGIELLREVKRLKPSIKVLLISGFSDFEYARQALRLGANDYELKPVSARVLLKKVSALKDEILKEKNSAVMLNDYKQEYKINTFENILLGKVDNYFIVKEFFETYYSQNNFYDFVMVLIDDDGDAQFDLFEIIRNHLGENYTKDVCYARLLGRHIILLNVPNSLLLVNLKKNEMKKLFESLTKTYNNRISAAISNGHPLKEIAGEYKSMNKLLTLKFYEGPGVCLFSSKASVKNDEKYLNELKRKMSNPTNSIAEFETLLDDFKAYCKDNYFPSPENTKRLLIETVQEFAGREACVELQNKLGNGLEKGIYLDELLNTVMESVQKHKEMNTELATKNYSHTVRAATNYINEHFCEQITIERVAQHVDKSPNYLSSIFNKEVGQSYTKYLNKIRIKRAKMLLLSTDMSLSEIAVATGYTDYTYFVAVFKRLMGYPPSAIRKNSTGEN